MECPKCGYEREPGDTHCSLCGVDFDLLERQAAEKKALKMMSKNGDSLNNGHAAHEPEKGSTPPPSFPLAPSESHPECRYSSLHHLDRHRASSLVIALCRTMSGLSPVPTTGVP